GQKIDAESLNKFLFLSDGYLSGEIERFALDATGAIDQPRTWNGTMSLQISNVDRPEIHFDSGVVEVSAEQGRATLRSADILQDKNEFHLHGTTELPAVIEDFGRTPATLEIAGTAPDLQRLTKETPVQLTGSAQFTGKIDIANANVNATLGVIANAVGFSDGTVDKLNCTLRASKGVARADTKRPWFADLRTAMEFGLAGIHYRDQIIDSVEGSLNSSDDLLGLDRLDLRRNQNQLNIRGRYRLPAEVGKAASQPAQLDFALNAPEAADFWTADSPGKLSGPLEMTGQIKWEHEVPNGQISISGSNIKMRDLVFRQLSTQCSISDNIVYLNDCRASLNDSDFFYATGRLNLRQPHHYNGKVSASIANLSTLQPLLRTFGNQNELAGTITLDWEGEGQGITASQSSYSKSTVTQAVAPRKNSGKLKLVLEKGRYGD